MSNNTMSDNTKSNTMSEIPNDRKYTNTHEWGLLTETNKVTVGITYHAQDLLGDVVFIELPQIGMKVKAGHECSVIESVKAATDIYSPVSGEIIAVNHELSNSPELVNQDPYGKGWIFVVQSNNLQEYAELLDAHGYEKMLSEEQEH